MTPYKGRISVPKDLQKTIEAIKQEISKAVESQSLDDYIKFCEELSSFAKNLLMILEFCEELIDDLESRKDAAEADKERAHERD